MIEITGVSKRFGEAEVVSAVNLQIPAGGVTALVGPNGAGKSTLLAMIARLTLASEGRILIDGLDTASTKSDVLARRIAILRQENQLAMRLTVEELVTFGRYPHSKGRLTEVDQGQVEKAISYLELEDLRRRFLDELSGGQRQRAFVAMVLAQDTDYLLLDEPLNNLDMRHASQMMKLLRRTADELGKTIIVVLHDINFAASYADRVVAMKEGRVMFNGTPDGFLEEKTLAEIYDMQIPVRQVDGRKLGLIYF